MLVQEDVGALYASQEGRQRDPEEYGRARLSHVADTWKGKLDPSEYLNPGRHGEWTSASGLCPAHNPCASLMKTTLTTVIHSDKDGQSEVYQQYFDTASGICPDDVQLRTGRLCALFVNLECGKQAASLFAAPTEDSRSA